MAESSAEQQGVTNVTRTLILAASGIPPNTADLLGRYESIASHYLTIANAGSTYSGQTRGQQAQHGRVLGG